MSLKWHLVLRLSLRFVRKRFSFVGKHSNFYPIDVLFIFCIFYLQYLDEEELIQQVRLKNI